MGLDRGHEDKKCVDFFLLKINILLPFIVINIVRIERSEILL